MHDPGIVARLPAADVVRTAAMRIGEVLSYQGRPVVLLGLEPMSVPDRHARVRDAETGEELDVPVAELEEAEGLPPPA